MMPAAIMPPMAPKSSTRRLQQMMTTKVTQKAPNTVVRTLTGDMPSQSM